MSEQINIYTKYLAVPAYMKYRKEKCTAYLLRRVVSMWKISPKRDRNNTDTYDHYLLQFWVSRSVEGLWETESKAKNKIIIIIIIITRKQEWKGKQLHGRFKRLINNISHDKTWIWLRKGNFKRKTESLLMAAQNSAIGTNHIKARIDKTQQNSKCRLCGERDETINHIISKCSKLAQEYKARHDWVGKVIHWEMCKKMKFDHANKWYMHNPALVLENDTYKFLWDLDIKTDHLISTRRPDLIIINNKKKKNPRKSAKLSTSLSRLTTE